MILWEEGNVSVNDIAKKLILNTNTVTPLLKRMEQLGILERQRSKKDERMVIVQLTEKGKQLQEQASLIPEKLANHLLDGVLKVDDLIKLKDNLNSIIQLLSK